MRGSVAGLLAAMLLAGCSTTLVGVESGPRAGAHSDAHSDAASDAVTTAAEDSSSPADAGGRPPAEAPVAARSPSPTTADTTSSPSPVPAPGWGDAALVLRDDAGFDDATVAAVEALDGVAALAGSRNDEVSLWSSAAADGSPVDAFADGFRVLVTALADTTDLPGPRLARGEVLLTPHGAALRGGLDVGGTVVLGPDRTPLTVVGVADDAEPYGRAELVVHPADGDAVALEPRDRLFLLVDEDADVEAVAADVRALLGTDDPRAVEVRERGPERGRRTLSVVEAKEQFGEFAFRDVPGSRDIVQEQAWIDEHVVTERVPLLGTVRCHRAIMDDLRAALEEVVAAGLGAWADPSRLGGCWYPRRIAEGGNLSKHAWGIALDVNVDFSVPGGGEVPPDEVIEAFRRNRFSWGGDFPTPDNHHFEWVGDDA